MIIAVGMLLVLLVGGYIGYPLFMKGDDPSLTVNTQQLRKINEEIEREILSLRTFPEDIS